MYIYIYVINTAIVVTCLDIMTSILIIIISILILSILRLMPKKEFKRNVEFQLAIPTKSQEQVFGLLEDRTHLFFGEPLITPG